MKDLFLFDIDGTLFNPQKFGELIRGRITEILNISDEELVSATAEYYAGLETTTDFNPRDIAAFIASRFGADKEDLGKVFWQEDSLYEESLYSDVKPALEKLSREKTLGIFSQGFEEFQRRKLTASGIDKYFEKDYIFVNRRKLLEESLMLLPSKATIIDDKHEVVDSIKDRFNVVWINRKSEEVDPNVITIYSLGMILNQE